MDGPMAGMVLDMAGVHGVTRAGDGVTLHTAGDGVTLDMDGVTLVMVGDTQDGVITHLITLVIILLITTNELLMAKDMPITQE